jgi:transposase
MNFIGIDLYSNKFACCYRRPRTGRIIKTFNLDSEGLEAFYQAPAGLGQIAEGFLSGGEASGVRAGPELTKDIVGYPVIAGRGYDSGKFRMDLRGNNNIPVIPGRKDRKEEIAYGRQLYKKRGLIERIFGKAKETRRLAVRYEKPDVNFLGFIIFAFIKINLC